LRSDEFIKNHCYDRISGSELIKFIAGKYFTKHRNITAINNEYKNRNNLQKLVKMPNKEAWVEGYRNLQLKSI